MKQKLLLALLAIFVSVGIVSAANEVEVTVHSGTVTVTKSGVTAGQTAVNWEASNITGTGTATTNGTTVTITAGTVTIAGGGAYTNLTINGKASVVEVDGADLKSLSVTGNGELTTLDLGTTALTSLSCSGNKLKVLPPKGNITTYNVGEQSPEPAPSGITTEAVPSNQPQLLTTTKLGLDAIAPLATGTSNTFTAQTWSKWNPTNSTWASANNEPKTDAQTALNTYYFSSSTNPVTYMDGSYRCDIKFNADSPYPNAVIKNVPVNVKPAVFTFGKVTITPTDAGNTDPQPSSIEGNTVEKGQIITFGATENDGYTFASYVPVGMKAVGDKQEGSNRQDFEVLGTVAPSITVNFKSGANTVTYDENQPNGTVKVYNGSTYIGTGTTVPTGTEISIVATPKNGYVVDAIKINSANPTSTETVGNVVTAKYKIANAQSYVINVSFIPSQGRSFTVKYKGEAIVSGAIGDGNTLSKAGVSGDQSDNFTSIKVGTQPAITIEAEDDYSISSIVINNKAQTVTNTRGKTYVVSGFTMPDEDVTMVINSVKLLAPEVFITNDPGAGNPIKYTYDGTPKALVYTTNPLNLSGFKVEYSETGNYTTGAYTNVGDYTVRFSRPADATYAAYPETERDLTIEPATPILTPPTVTITKVPNTTDQYQYTISGGSAQYVRGTGKQTVPGTGKWEIIDQGDNVTIPSTQQALKDKSLVTQPFTSATAPKSTLVVLRYTAMTNSTTANPNFYLAGVVTQAKGSDNLKDITVEVLTTQLPANTTLTILNGGQSLGTKGIVKKGTKVTFEYSAPGYNEANISIKQVDATGNPLTGAVDLKTSGIAATDADGTRMLFKLFYNGTPPVGAKEIFIEKATYSEEYDGSAKLFDVSGNPNFVVKEKPDNTPVSVTTNWSITYKNASGTTVVAPINAGTYTVSFTRPADATYKAVTGTGTLTIKKAKPVIKKYPDYAYLASGQDLSAAVFIGGSADIPGAFVFIESGKPVNGTQYTLKFVPSSAMSANYDELVTTQTMPVTYSNKRFVVIETPVNGAIIVRDNLGKQYTNGEEIGSTATSLTITATPNTGFNLASLTVNGTNITSGSSYTIGNATSVNVKAVFSAGTSFTVTMNTPRGVQVVQRPATNVVNVGGSYIFTIATAVGDVPVVTDQDGTVYSGSNGQYTIPNIVRNMTIRISLPNPTVIDFKVTQPPVDRGTVDVVNSSALTRAYSGEYYYGDTLTLTAIPKGNYDFDYWWDNSKVNPRTYIVKGAVEIQALFYYNPDAIEPVEGLEVYGGEGNIYVSAPAEVTVTIVSMNGTATKTRVHGQQYIPVSTGIYGVVVEQGDKQSKLKVVVR